MSAVLEDRPGRRLFGSAHQALMFAYTYSENQHGEAAAAERKIALFARGRYPDPPRPASRGLSGLDGAGQAGMILASINRLPRHLVRVLDARFALLSERVRRLAMLELALRLRDSLPDRDLNLAYRLVARHYGSGQQLMDLAMQWNMPERTMRRRWAAVRRELRMLDGQAMARAEIELETREIIPPIDGD